MGNNDKKIITISREFGSEQLSERVYRSIP